ncbi:MAG: EVE domain-containing protein [Reinekea sp.]|nr:EVE domain-containing protein [Reinekea sp.]
MSPSIWLLKTEPNEFSIDDLKARGKAGEPWDGIRNYQARNFLRDMKKGDLAFIYHSACDIPAIAGLAVVQKSAYPDTAALDPTSKYFDEKSAPDNIRWSRVDVAFKTKFKQPLPLKQIKSEPALAEMKLVRSSRLSVSPVTQQEYETIMALVD